MVAIEHKPPNTRTFWPRVLSLAVGVLLAAVLGGIMSASDDPSLVQANPVWVWDDVRWFTFCDAHWLATP